MSLAYKEGRGPSKNPSEGWYAGELCFFDNYIIPLAEKLRECGVFGVSSDECLNYARENRKEVRERVTCNRKIRCLLPGFLSGLSLCRCMYLRSGLSKGNRLLKK